jgi:hypothetical protein
MLFKFNKTSYDTNALRNAFKALLDDNTRIQDREKYLKLFKAWCVQMQTDILNFKAYQRKQSKNERKESNYYDTKYDPII